MKINGKKIEGPNIEIIAIPRANTDDIIFQAQSVLDMTSFEQMCPVPVPPIRKMANGEEIPNFQDKGYLAAIQNLATKRLAWIVLASLQVTEGLEWETVDLSDPSTWELFRKELRESGFSDVEINRIIAGCISVNALNEEKIEAARERFLRTAQEALSD